MGYKYRRVVPILKPNPVRDPDSDWLQEPRRNSSDSKRKTKMYKFIK